jgi:hypothetical protein
MVLAAPGPLLTPPPSSSPPKTPHRSYSVQKPITKLFAWGVCFITVGGKGECRTCTMRDDEPRPVWMRLPITHCLSSREHTPAKFVFPGAQSSSDCGPGRTVHLYCLFVLPGAQILLDCAPGSTIIAGLCSWEHKYRLIVSPEAQKWWIVGAHISLDCAPGAQLLLNRAPPGAQRDAHERIVTNVSILRRVSLSSTRKSRCERSACACRNPAGLPGCAEQRPQYGHHPGVP